MYMGRPLFPGTSALDQLIKMVVFYGTRPFTAIKGAKQFLKSKNMKSLPYHKSKDLRNILPNSIDENAYTLLKGMLHID